MKLPRDLSSAELEKSLRRTFGYEFTRQVGSHRRVTTLVGGQHHLTIPQHDPIRVGTLRTILVKLSSTITYRLMNYSPNSAFAKF